MKNERETKRKSNNRQAPLSPAEVLLRDNVPASEALPADIAERFARNRVYLVSNDEDFDPKKCLTKVKGLKRDVGTLHKQTCRQWVASGTDRASGTGLTETDG